MDVGIGLRPSAAPPPLLYSQLFFTSPPSPELTIHPNLLAKWPPFCIPSTALRTCLRPSLHSCWQWRRRWSSSDHLEGQECNGRRRGGKQQVLPIGHLRVSSLRGLTKIAYSRSGDPTGNLRLRMGWRWSLVNPLAPELPGYLSVSAPGPSGLRSQFPPPATVFSCGEPQGRSKHIFRMLQALQCCLFSKIKKR